MARGKDTCRILKDIRRQIAKANDIEFIASECRYKDDCLGTCPKCEYSPLEDQEGYKICKNCGTAYKIFNDETYVVF